jgi:glycosyltransferase involved in cell wall biosynthesis
MKVLFLSTIGDSCGIATYTTNLIKGFAKDVTCTQFPLPNRNELASYCTDQVDTLFTDFINMCDDFDVIHIQHEHGLFYGVGDESDAVCQFGKIIQSLVKKQKKVFVTFHSEPVFFRTWLDVIKRRDGFLPTLMMRTLSKIWKKKVSRWFTKKYPNVTAIVHNIKSKGEFIKSGFDVANVKVISHGVISRKIPFKEIRPKQDIINLTIFGFLSAYKGYHAAIRALQLLPENYRLICMGGRHPNSSGSEYDDILFFAADRDRETNEHKLPLNLVYDRITITGFVDEEDADIWHKKTDICLAPYDDRTLSGSGALTWSLTSGRPVIACNIPAFQAINNEYNCMQITAVQAHHELAWAIKKVVNDVKSQRVLTHNANKYCIDNSWEVIAKQHMNLYESVANSSE